jgi:photosystem II stability/assembly factor-like uncharacterized protein
MSNRLQECCLKIAVLFIVVSSTTFSQTGYWELAGTPSGIAIQSIAFAPNGHLFASTSPTSAFYKSVDNGNSWIRIDTNVGSAYKKVIAVSQTSGTIIIAGGDTIYRSTDEGKIWTPIPCSYSIMNLTSSPTGVFFAGTPVNGPSRSTDDGLTWEKQNTGLTQFSMYAFAFKDSGVVFTSSYGSAVYRSTNNGESWTPVPIMGSYSDVLSLVAQSNGYLFAGTSSGVFRTTNNGDTWTSINNGLSSTYIQSLCISSRQHIFAGTSGGVFRSIDLGGGWTEIDSGLINLNIHCLAIGSDGKLYAGTESGQVFRTIGSTTSIQQSSLKPINTFSLSQNYPNPFNPTTMFSFSLPSRSFVSLKVYDLLGKEVATIISEEMSTGKYSKQWNAVNVSSGIYFYHLQAGSFSETKKLILLK